MTAPTPRRLVPATATFEMAAALHDETPYCHADHEECQAIIGDRTCYQAADSYAAAVAASPHAGRVSREDVKVGIRAHYNAPEFYEPSIQAMEGAVRFLEALGLEIEPAQEAGDATPRER
jgi:hypothetical protein